ncbi:hypothetical protein LGH70_23355 [Hymenobacter sp. BT635]|uniref:Uncharacterized protein n=1 Tax=Hymenobacter nitidus TaxID=2880929 RepID=A0ABS8AJU6_9BACT|nr:hypothetical protein [Hymenobacter nitidus]MCB2380551.1 hypothetical protein [Hymenobacter nitidus]
MKPSNRTKLYKYTNWCSREKKRAFRDWSGVQRREQNKNSKVLEASDLRAFYKLYIIDNQWLINIIVELMYCFELGNATASETGAAEDAGRGGG